MMIFLVVRVFNNIVNRDHGQFLKFLNIKRRAFESVSTITLRSPWLTQCCRPCNKAKDSALKLVSLPKKIASAKNTLPQSSRITIPPPTSPRLSSALPSTFNFQNAPGGLVYLISWMMRRKISQEKMMTIRRNYWRIQGQEDCNWNIGNERVEEKNT